jgi:hypothetical protein
VNKNIQRFCVSLLALSLSACVTTNASRLATSSETRPLVLPANVALYRIASQVPRPYEEVALLNSTGDSNFTNEAKMFESMKKEAGKVGANGVILDALSEPSGGAKVAAAIFGVSAQRKGKALAIWVFPAGEAPRSAAASVAPAPNIERAPPAAKAASYIGNAAPAAKAELAKQQCNDNFGVVSESEGRSIFEATCKSTGKRQLMECWMGACRALN